MAETPTDDLLQFFTADQLPVNLYAAAQKFGELARWIVQVVPESGERKMALRQLLEAKDQTVRAVLYQSPE